MPICKGKTKNNKRCKNKSQNKYCHLHKKNKIKKGGNKRFPSPIKIRPQQPIKSIRPPSTNKICDPKGYHKVCDRVWSANCSFNYDKMSNQHLRQDALECSKKRMNHMNKCFSPDKWDSGHIGAIARMIKKKESCDEIIRQKR